jgi:hypothetical protein
MANVWKDKLNRTILLSSIFLVLILALLVFFIIFSFEDQELPGLNWAFETVPLIIFVSLIFWGIYFNLLLLVGSIREKMNVLPSWTEVAICALITLVSSIFVGNLEGFDIKWVVFGGTFLGVVLVTLWFLFSTTEKEGAIAQ